MLERLQAHDGLKVADVGKEHFEIIQLLAVPQRLEACDRCADDHQVLQMRHCLDKVDPVEVAVAQIQRDHVAAVFDGFGVGIGQKAPVIGVFRHAEVVCIGAAAHSVEIHAPDDLAVVVAAAHLVERLIRNIAVAEIQLFQMRHRLNRLFRLSGIVDRAI